MGEGLDWLRTAVHDGQIHTVRVSFADRLGVWRGKRVPVDLFMEDPTRPVGFCDGMLVCDVHADLVQDAPFSNYETGYPDFYVHPDPAAIRPVGWFPGEAYAFGDLRDERGQPTAVAPRSALGRAAERARAEGGVSRVTLALSGRLMYAPDRACDLTMGLVLSDADRVLTRAADGLAAGGITVDAVEVDQGGRFTLRLSPLAPCAAGEAGVVAKSALKELARSSGLEAIFMTRPMPDAEPSTWLVDVATGRPAEPASAGRRFRELAEDARGLVAPSVTAFRTGPLTAEIRTSGAEEVVFRLAASAEASPETAVACAIAATVEAARDTGHEPGSRPVATLLDAAERLGSSSWLHDWLGAELPVNSAPLLRAEQAMFDAAVTDWELRRYWKAS